MDRASAQPALSGATPWAKYTEHPRTREEHLADICAFEAAGPMPVMPPDEVARWADRTYARLDDTAFAGLLELIVRPASVEEYAPLDSLGFEARLGECVAAAIDDRADRLAAVCDLVVSPATRALALGALYAFSLPVEPVTFNRQPSRREPQEPLRRVRDDALPLLLELTRRTPPLEGDTQDLAILIECLERRQVARDP